jgi:hypothetical protein
MILNAECGSGFDLAERLAHRGRLGNNSLRSDSVSWGDNTKGNE